MSANLQDTIHGVPRRPRIADASANTILWAIAGGLIAGPAGALIGGVAGSAIGQQRQPLEMAIREFFTKHGLEVVFYSPAPRSVKVTFRYGPEANAYWTLESRIPDHVPLQPEDKDDWLYGNLINQLPYVLQTPLV